MRERGDDPIDTPLSGEEPVVQEPLPGMEEVDDEEDDELDEADGLKDLPIPDDDEDH